MEEVAAGSERPRFEVELEAPTTAVKAVLPDWVEAWGGEWTPRLDGGALRLPVAAGLRRGVVEGRIEVAGNGAGSRVTLEIEHEEYLLQWPAVAILAVGAAGGLLMLVWPLYPRLLGLAPVGALAAFSAWFLVNARLSNKGPQEFLDGLGTEIELAAEIGSAARAE